MTCTHPMEHWVVTVTIMIPTERGGKQPVPSEWYCMDCGKRFHRIEKCPTCNTPMEVSGYLGMFPARFRCPADGQFFFRKDLPDAGEVIRVPKADSWWQRYRNRVFFAAFLLSLDVFGGLTFAACLGVKLSAHVLLTYAWYFSAVFVILFWYLTQRTQWRPR
jgi:ABC-type sugar transport system permease subunit